MTVAQAAAAGVSERVIETRVRRGEWQRLHRGVVVATRGPVPPAARLVAALLYSGHGAAIGHATAAILHGLPVPDDRLVHVIVPQARRVAPSPGLRIHRATHWDARDVSRRGAIVVTTVDRTVVDCLHSLPHRSAARALAAAALQSRRTTAERLLAAAERTQRPSWVRALLRDISDGSHSELELRFLRLCRNHGLPTPARQVPVGRHVVDAAFGEVLVELDSRAFHLDAASWERDLARQNELLQAGRVLLRFTWQMVCDQPDVVVAQLLAAGVGDLATDTVGKSPTSAAG